MTGGLLFFCFILFYGCGAIQCILMYSYVLNHYHKCFATKRLVGRLALVSHDVGDVPICEFMDSHIKCHYNRVDLLHVLGVNVAIYLPLLFLSVIFFAPPIYERCLISQHVIMKASLIPLLIQ